MARSSLRGAFLDYRGAPESLPYSAASRIVTAHAARIWAEQRPGGGAAFHFTLPLSGPPPDAPPEEEVLAAAAEIAEEAEAEAEIAPAPSKSLAAATADLVDEVDGNGAGDGKPAATGPPGDNGWGYSPPRPADGTDGDNVEVGS